jgi:hypothetical protein
MSNNCTQGEHDQGIVCLTWGQRIGLALDAEAGLISVAALIGAFVLIVVSHDVCDGMDSINSIAIQIKVWRRKKLVQRPMDLFVVSLQAVRATFIY